MDVRKELEDLYERNKDLDRGASEMHHHVALLSNMTDLLCQIATWDCAHELAITFQEEREGDVYLPGPLWSGIADG